MDLPTSSSSKPARAGTTTTTTSSAPLMTSAATRSARDKVYCLELAKRSVARAALHLGVGSLSKDALQTLADILCEYLERLGGVLAHNVEASGRTTQHVHALDVLQAVELCTSPAVQRVHFTGNSTTTTTAAAASSSGGEGGPEGETSSPTSSHVNAINQNPLARLGKTARTTPTTTSNHDNHGETENNNTSTESHAAAAASTTNNNPTSWQGLAAFCFGPNWMHETKAEKLLDTQLEVQGGAGGKVGPRASSEREESAKDVQEGWRAPFPDEVPPFPLVSSSSSSKKVANPHTMSQKEALWALYGNQPTPISSTTAAATTTMNTSVSRRPSDILRGQTSLQVNTEAAEEVYAEKQKSLQELPESVWGGLTPKTAAAASAKNDGDVEMTDVTSKENSGDASKKRKLEETTQSHDGGGGDANKTTNVKQEEGANPVAATATDKSKKDAMDVDKKDDAKKPATDTDGNKASTSTTAAGQPAKKKVKLEDGSAKPTKAASSSSKSKKKAAADEKAAKAAKAAEEAKQKAEQRQRQDEQDAQRAKAMAQVQAAGGRTHNYVPLFYPPIPKTALGGGIGIGVMDGSSAQQLLRQKTTVVDLLESSSSSNKKDGSNKNPKQSQTTGASAATTTDSNSTFGLRSALVQLGTSYWGSHADDPAINDQDDDGKGESMEVPPGRSGAAAAASGAQNPIVPLGRASGSRVSRILEGSMDAAAM